VPARVMVKKPPTRGGLFDSVASNIHVIAVGLKYFLNPRRSTLVYPKEYPKLDEGYRGFIVLEKKKCISCAACARICPSAAMKMVKVPEPDPRHKDRVKMKQYPVINYQRCIFCGYCVDVCPTEALYHVPYHDVVYENLAEMFLDLESFQEPPEYYTAREGRPVRYVIDEEVGLVKVPVEEEK